MSDYRRLISYIYAYDKDVKGHSVGFAKLESRNGQCKISVSVKKLYTGNAEWNVYLLTGEQEIPIGHFYIRGQGGEFRTAVQSENVEQSGYPLTAMHGLSLHGEQANEKYYMTIWEEPNVHAAELEVESELQAAEEAKAAEMAEKVEEHAEIEVETQIQVDTPPYVLTAFVPDALHMEEQEQSPDTLSAPESEYAPEQETAMEPTLEDPVQEISQDMLQDVQELQEPDEIMDTAECPTAECLPEPEEVSEKENISEEENTVTPENVLEPENPSSPEMVLESEPVSIGERQPEENNWQVYAQTASRGQLPLWEKLRKRYAKIQAFDYAGGCEILTIKPQDIGLLPRENWVYGNNSFLLHAYYNYRYLILVKLDEQDGACRYLLGVPGMYYTNEKYMASMFGFSEFILAKKQPHKDGRFGYWYTEIKIGI